MRKLLLIGLVGVVLLVAFALFYPRQDSTPDNTRPPDLSSIPTPFIRDADYLVSAYRGQTSQAHYWGYVIKLAGAGCYYVERRNTSGTWLRTSFEYRPHGENATWQKAGEGVYDCVADSEYNEYRVWNGPNNGVTGIRFANPTLGRTINACLTVADCLTQPVYDWNTIDTATPRH
jgi:hypothetical protein